MKCKICGYELDSGRSYCPMCGTPVSEEDKAQAKVEDDLMFKAFEGRQTQPVRTLADDADFSWNTKDFPKPKTPRDIKMRWTMRGLEDETQEPTSVMSEDASEGYVVSKIKEAAPAPAPAPAKAEPAPAPKPQPEAVKPAAPKPAQPQPQAARPAAPKPAQPQPQAARPAAPKPQPAQTEAPRHDAPRQPQAAAGIWNMPLWYTQPLSPIEESVKGASQTTPLQNTVSSQPTFSIPAMPQMPQMFTASGYINVTPVQMQPQQPLPQAQPQTPAEPQEAAMPKEAPAPAPAPAPAFEEPAQPEAAGVPEDEPIALTVDDLIAMELPEEPTAPIPVIKEPFAEPAAPAEPVPVAPAVPEVPAEPVPAAEPEKPVAEPVEATEPAPAEPAQPAPEEPKPVDSDWLKAETAAAAAEAAASDGPRRTQFHTFVRKNEEFQALLDKEYARLSSLGYDKDTPPVRSSRPDFHSPAESVKAEDLSAFERMLLDGTEEDAPDKTLVIDRAGLAAGGAAAAAAGAVKAASSVKQAGGAAPATPKNEREIVEKRISATLNKDTIEMKLAEMREREKAEADLRSERRKKLDEMARARAEFFGNLDQLNNDNDKGDKPVDSKGVVKEAPDETPVKEEKEEKSKKKKVDDDDFLRPNKPSGFLIFLLVLAILAGIIFGGRWAILKYAPNSIASDIVTQVSTAVGDSWNSVVKKAREVLNFYTGEKEKQEVPEDLAPIDTSSGQKAELDLDSLVAAADSKGNIGVVKLNSALKYDPASEVKVGGLDSSAQVTDIKTVSDIYSTMIAYNSAWIDFVNSGGDDQRCLGYLKDDGNAYKAAIGFDRLGEVTHTFEALELGEVRSNGDHFYIFVKEDLKESDGTNESLHSAETVYRLEKSGAEYKIVDYK